MVLQEGECQRFTIHQPEARAVFVACDCLGWFLMRKVDETHWQLTLQLPHGHYHLRYYVQTGGTTRLYDQEDVEIGSASAKPNAALSMEEEASFSSPGSAQRSWHVRPKLTARAVEPAF